VRCRKFPGRSWRENIDAYPKWYLPVNRSIFFFSVSLARFKQANEVDAPIVIAFFSVTAALVAQATNSPAPATVAAPSGRSFRRPRHPSELRRGGTLPPLAAAPIGTQSPNPQIRKPSPAKRPSKAPARAKARIRTCQGRRRLEETLCHRRARRDSDCGME